MCRDPEIRYSGTGEKAMAIARMTVAVNRRYKKEGGPTADFFTCIAFGKSASFAEKYLKQGYKVTIRGSMIQDNYTNKEGHKVTAWNLTVDELDFGESRGNDTDSNPYYATPKNEPGPEAAADKNPESKFMDIPDELGDEGFPFA